MPTASSPAAVAPVVKHMPGHGRATVDSHLDLPVVSASRDELAARDFPPFAALNDLPMAMTAHIVFTRDRRQGAGDDVAARGFGDHARRDRFDGLISATTRR